MFIRVAQQVGRGESPRLHHEWVSIGSMAEGMPRAAMAGEDARFLHHWGFDLKAIEHAAKHNRNHTSRLGASTITQQTAKNVFLWPGRSWIRKGFEAYFTVLIELTWSKSRIMEVYLNSIEMGDGIYGVEAVAKRHFHCRASELSDSQCALIAASLPNPIKYNSAEPGPYLRKRQSRILGEMRHVERLK